MNLELDTKNNPVGLTIETEPVETDENGVSVDESYAHEVVEEGISTKVSDTSILHEQNLIKEESIDKYAPEEFNPVDDSDIRNPEDANMSFQRGEITAQEYRKYLGRFGVTGPQADKFPKVITES